MFIGREEEIKKLRSAYEADESKFIAIYGRRRVGKTCLVREAFKEDFTFTYSGMPNVSTRIQLRSFYNALKSQGLDKSNMPQNWIDAFALLSEFIENQPEGKKVIFLDELPWMDAPRSSFVPAFEQFWNGWASARKDILLVICGSATSWMVNKVFKNRGGLHNRLSYRICLQPFTLKECERYSNERRLGYTREMLLETYMVLGGIPYYWSLLEKGKGMAQNIDNLFFKNGAVLGNEFDELYSSLFKNPAPYIDIITALGKKKAGMTREEIIKAAKLSDNGKVGDCLEELDACGFIRRYNSFGAKKKNAVYQLIDNFTLFYFRFIESQKYTDEAFWSKSQRTPAYHNWCGLAFESVCLLHIRQIKKALGIGGVISNEYSWRTAPYADLPGVEIDLLIDRADRVFNLCEMKYTESKFTIDKRYSAVLKNKAQRLYDVTKSRNAVFLTLISANGVTANIYAGDIPCILTADDLFD
ncbi:MAG: ATP-binding protein [Muribaculaceae bacterium]|nr:ATP-binding protein [Muribaculaceae bacterium]